MTIISEYLDECKKKLNISSTYALAKIWEISEGALNNYYSGKRIPDEFACFKIAETLEIDAAYVIARIKSESEKDPKKAEYFRVFGGALRRQGVNILMAVVCVVSLLSVQDTTEDNLFIALASSAATVLFLNFVASYNGRLRQRQEP